jgi:hypothetical protein
MTRSRGINRPRWNPTPDQLDILRAEFCVTATPILAERFGVAPHQVYRRAWAMDLTKDPAYLADLYAKAAEGRGAAGRFRAGNVPWSKGKKLPGNAGPTAFKPGNPAHNVAPVGALRVCSIGYLQRKVTATGKPQHDWQMVHRLVWQAAHGTIPAGYVVAFRRGMRTTVKAEITVDRLELVSQRDMMTRNSITNMPPELAQLSRLRGRVVREINKQEKAR